MISEYEKLPESIQSKEDLALVQGFILQGAQLLTDLAGSYGFVLTIQTAPKLPLAMGNYDYQCELRISHDAYRSK